MFILPYSPRWLASVGRTDEARETLIRLHGGRKNANLDIIEGEVQKMLTQLEWERENVSTNYLDLVRTKPNLHRTVCGVLVQAMCQWTGVNVNKYVLLCSEVRRVALILATTSRQSTACSALAVASSS